MQKYSKPKFDPKKLGVNPFSFSLEITVKELEIPRAYQLRDGLELPVINELEATPFAKMFVSPERRIIVSNLCPASKELLVWLMYELEAGSDFIWINRERYLVENNTSINTYKKAVEEVIRYGLLAQTVIQGVYWFNPDFFFRGDRLRKYPKNLKLAK
jgi:hypothetical protein